MFLLGVHMIYAWNERTDRSLGGPFSFVSLFLHPEFSIHNNTVYIALTFRFILAKSGQFKYLSIYLLICICLNIIILLLVIY